MGQISKLYKDYENQPYISNERNLEDWEDFPESFPYGKVERKQMVLLDEGLFPGDIIMLWRISFDNFTNESTIPNYFEYRYGVNSDDSIQRLIDKGYIYVGDVYETVNLINAVGIKRILKTHGLKLAGAKQEIVERLLEGVSKTDLEEAIVLRRYVATDDGRELLLKYDAIIQTHGPKQL